MNQQLLVIMISILLGYQNSKNTTTDFTLDSFEKTIAVTNGKVYKNDSLFLSNPRWLKFHPDSFLIISELDNSGNFIKIIDLKSNTVQEMITVGMEPGEMITPWGLGIINKKIWVSDGQTGKICILTMDSNRKFSISREFNLKGKLTMGTNVLSSGLVVCLTGMEDTINRLTYFDSSGNILKKVEGFPKLKNNNEIPSDNNIFSSAISSTPKGDKVILACVSTDIIEIYNAKKGLKKRIQGPLGIEISAKRRDVGMGYMTSTIPNYSTFYNISCSDSEFWVSYSGQLFEKGDYRTPEKVFPKSILCFNIDGKPMQILNFSHNILYFDVDWNNKVIYCLEWTKEGSLIVSYHL